MLMLVMRMLMSVFPFIKEMLLSVDRGNYSKIAIVLTVLLLIMIVLNIVETRVVFVTITQRNIAIKENTKLKKKQEELTPLNCTSNNDLSVAHIRLITSITNELIQCNAKLNVK